MLKQMRDPVSGIMHLAAAIAAGGGLVVLLYARRDGWAKELSLLVYGISLIGMFSASAAYHLPKARPSVVLFLRKIDHSAIYFLIAGTYTPICLHYFDGFWRWGILAIIWSMAVVGIAVKVFVINAPRWITAGVYLVMGWLSLIAIKEMLALIPAGALAWLLAGGLFFTVGAVIYMLRRPNLYPGVFGFHEMWHIFVILGCLSHYIAIAAFVAAHHLPA